MSAARARFASLPALAFSFSLCAALTACSDDAARRRSGAVWVVAESAVSAPPRGADDARALAERTPRLSFRKSSRGKPFGVIAVFGRPARAMQVGLVITEESDDGARVVYADELDAAPDLRHFTGVVTPPPGATWPRPCRTYALRFSSSAGELAERRVVVPGCAKAIEDLRARALFHVGKGGPPLFSFEGSLRAYKKKLGARSLLRAPLGRAPFFLGWKAAFRGPANAKVVRVRTFETASGRVAAEDDLTIDPTWDSVGGGWEIPAEPSWPKAGLGYSLIVWAPREDEKKTPPGEVGGVVEKERVMAKGNVVVAESK